MLEVHDMLLDLGAKKRLVKQTTGKNDDTAKSVVRLQHAKTFTADEA